MLLYRDHLHYLVAEVVDDLDGDAAGFGFREWARDVAPEAGPGFLVDLRPQCRLQRFVGVGRGAEEIGVADEEAFFVVIGVNEPQRDRVGAARFDLARLRLEDIDALDLDLDLVITDGLDRDVGLRRRRTDCRRRCSSIRLPCADRGSCAPSGSGCGRCGRVRPIGHRN
jgi:hypothetical protein